MEKGIVLGMATQAQSASDGLCDLVHNYASILAAQGSMDQALQYMDLIPGEPSESVHLLRDRILGTSNQIATNQPSGHGSAMHGMVRHQPVHLNCWNQIDMKIWLWN